MTARDSVVRHLCGYSMLRRSLCSWIGPYRSSRSVAAVRDEPVGALVKVCGFLKSVRALGHLMFIVVDDGAGRVQAVWSRDEAIEQRNEEHFNQMTKDLKVNMVCSIEGVIKNRSEGDKEIAMTNLSVLSKVTIPRWPIPDSSSPLDNEPLFLRHRHLQLRRPDLHHRIEMRSRASFAIRSFLHKHSFIEIDTPLLLPSSPEGAGEFIVPTRQESKFFALAQSPQQFKQLLICGGFDRYFQFARCFRDEDGRSDRQVEFTQIDVEMAFVTQEEVMNVTEAILRDLQESIPGLKLCFPPTPLRRIAYYDAIANYGTDKPDLRYDMKFHSLEGGWSVFHAPNLGRIQTAHLRREGLYIVPIRSSSLPKTSFLSTPVETLMELFNPIPGDCLIFSKDRRTLGAARSSCAEALSEKGYLDLSNVAPEWLWVTDFPLFELGNDGCIQCVHHPFTSPANYAQFDEATDVTSLLALRAQSYDLVVNGIEMGGGSIRIHNEAVQRRVIRDILCQNEAQFKTLLEALSHGAPPHGGLAIGFDRLLCEFLPGARSLRDVIAFPKTAQGQDLLMRAPAPLHDSEQQLARFGLIRQPSPHPQNNASAESSTII